MIDNDVVLLRRFVKSGDSNAFSEIINRYAGLVYGASIRVLDDRDRAADVVQETFLQLLRQAENITDSLAGWLHKVATRKAIDLLRSDSSRIRREARYSADKPIETEEWKDISHYIDEELNKLDRETRDILIKHFLQGQSMADVAKSVGLSQPTVSRRIESGVLTLRAGLKKRGIIVAAFVLGSLLTENTVQAAPAFVIQELGKMAIAGSAAATGAAGAKTAAAGLLATVKAKVITTAVIATVGVGGIVTYNHVTREPEQPQNYQSAASETIESTKDDYESSEPKVVIVDNQSTDESVEKEYIEPFVDKQNHEPADNIENDEDYEVVEEDKGYGGYGGGYYGGGMYGGGMVGVAPEQDQQENPDEPNDGSQEERISRRKFPGSR